jgi:hypothetical protein
VQIESVTKLPLKSYSNAKDRMVKEAVSLKENKIRRRKRQGQCIIVVTVNGILPSNKNTEILVGLFDLLSVQFTIHMTIDLSTSKNINLSIQFNLSFKRSLRLTRHTVV